MRTVSCPTCAAPVPWTGTSAFRPFCSERCKKIDLGAWASDAYRIPGGGDENVEPDDPDRDGR